MLWRGYASLFHSTRWQLTLYLPHRFQNAAADTVFVALAGGGGYAEREVCEKKLAEWRTSGPRGGAFDEAKFLAAVKQGRTELAIGWASFLGTNGLFLSCIVAPTNPFAKTLEALVDQVKESAL